MLDRAQVDHVAKLARLELSDADAEKMVGELSSVLDHVAAIRELNLEGVEPTSHVIDLVNALREDVPQPSLPLELALGQAPERTPIGFGVPSPGASVE